MVAPDLDLPADINLSGTLVLRFGGVSRGKSRRLMGCGGVRTRETGEFGLDVGPTLRLLRVGVDGLEAGRVIGDWGRGVGVDGLMVLSKEVVEDGRLLEGVA
ncbi:hypothetical protein L1987_83059 [Smallanthus sonchifolius]|uniref:Uncharacterized protein n=1 Tax=Smallanthus sonchifolius TaxID=185202 RepID=A0ACB8YAW7_9ASTR|nr:hypothetical protein L1987_83059 [Smallanthus sonchifolius]